MSKAGAKRHAAHEPALHATRVWFLAQKFWTEIKHRLSDRSACIVCFVYKDFKADRQRTLQKRTRLSWLLS